MQGLGEQTRARLDGMKLLVCTSLVLAREHQSNGGGGAGLEGDKDVLQLSN